MFDVVAIISVLCAILITLGVVFLVLFFVSKSKSKSPSAFDYFHPTEQNIYHYWDGERKRSVDPMVIYKKYMAKADVFKHHITLAKSMHSQSAKGQDDLMAEICLLFDVKRYEEGKGGLTEDSLAALFNHYFEYNETVKKNTRPSTTTPKGPSPSSPPSPGKDPVTKPATDSGSTGTADASDSPTPSPSGSASPTDS